MGTRRVRFTDEQRRRLAVAGKAVGRKALLDLAGLVTPDARLPSFFNRVEPSGPRRQNSKVVVEETGLDFGEGQLYASGQS